MSLLACLMMLGRGEGGEAGAGLAKSPKGALLASLHLCIFVCYYCQWVYMVVGVHKGSGSPANFTIAADNYLEEYA